MTTIINIHIFNDGIKRFCYEDNCYIVNSIERFLLKKVVITARPINGKDIIKIYATLLKSNENNLECKVEGTVPIVIDIDDSAIN